VNNGLRMNRQLPKGDEIFLDHIGHFVPDVESARRALIRAGFAPTPVSIQVNPEPGGASRPTGTGNVTAMLSQGYVEVLFRTTDTPLARELDAAMARYSGIHLTAFAVANAAVFHHRLAGHGFRVRPLVKMQRPVETEAASGTAAFTIARVLALTGVVIAVADVEEAAARFARFTGRAAALSQFGHTITLDRGRIELVSGEGLQHMLPDIPIPALPFMAACEIKVASLTRLRDMLERAGMSVSERGQVLIVQFPPEIGQGAWLFFE